MQPDLSQFTPIYNKIGPILPAIDSVIAEPNPVYKRVRISNLLKIVMRDLQDTDVFKSWIEKNYGIIRPLKDLFGIDHQIEEPPMTLVNRIIDFIISNEKKIGYEALNRILYILKDLKLVLISFTQGYKSNIAKQESVKELKYAVGSDVYRDAETDFYRGGRKDRRGFRRI